MESFRTLETTCRFLISLNRLLAFLAHVTRTNLGGARARKVYKVGALGSCTFALHHVRVQLAFFMADDALMTVKHAILADCYVNLVSKFHLHDLFGLFALFDFFTIITIVSAVALVVFFTLVLLKHNHSLM